MAQKEISISSMRNYYKVNERLAEKHAVDMYDEEGKNYKRKRLAI